MAIPITCPACQSALKSATAPAPGTPLKCPKCGQSFRYAGEARPPAIEPAAPPVPSPSTLAVANRPASRRTNAWLIGVAAVGVLAVATGAVYLVTRSSSGPPVAEKAPTKADEPSPMVLPLAQGAPQAIEPQDLENQALRPTAVGTVATAAVQPLTLPASLKGEYSTPLVAF